MTRHDRLNRLSLAAIRMAASGFLTQPDAIARWLYRFGTVPRSPAVLRDFGPDDDPLAVLGLTTGGPSRRLIEPLYQATTYPGWYGFVRGPADTRTVSACKLYVSPRPEALADAFPGIVRVFAACDVPSFKVGRGIAGLLRPDKIMAYFNVRSHMDEVARELTLALDAFPAQGVPFTGEAGGNGMLSFGFDPPHPAGLESWRSWVTRQIAQSLAKGPIRPGVDPVPGVLAALQEVGVDTAIWQPTATIRWTG